MDAMFLSLGQSGGNVKYSCNIFSAELKNVCAVISLQDYVFWSYVQEVNWAYIAWNSEWMTGVRFPSGSDIFLFVAASTVCGAHTAFCAMLQGAPFPKTFFSSSQHRQSVGPTPPSVPCCKGLLFPRIKLPKCELDHSALSSDQLKIGWRNTSCPTCNCANVHSYL